MPNYNDPKAAANRIRAATASLTDPRDWDVATQYVRELEALAREKTAVQGLRTGPDRDTRARDARSPASGRAKI